MNEDYIIEKIKTLMPPENHIPRGVLYSKLKTAVQEDLSETLNTLLKQKRVTYSKTLNGILIKPITDE